jgi:hypothetical protein
MIWFLEKGSDIIACEARRKGTHFELTVSEGDGSERAEEFDNPSVLVDRLVECQLGLHRDGWRILTNGLIVSTESDE